MKTYFLIVMGVSGCGKSSVGQSLARSLGWDFYDADDFHPPENVAKMARGTPLDDSARAPWLASLHELISSNLKADTPGVLACSALKERYRQQLMDGNDGVQLVYLKGTYEMIWSRMEKRTDHYMKPHMLQSQFEALEEPTDALTMDISLSVEDIVQDIIEQYCLEPKVIESLKAKRNNLMSKADIGLIGLAVMGQNLVLNMDDHGFTVAVFNRTVPKVDKFLKSGAKGTQVIGTHSLEELVNSLKQPRRVMLMVQAGKAVDDFIETLLPLLEPGDIIIDGGNSNYNDSIRRTAYLESKGLLFIGTGVSGGEEGARFGPSIMPGGSPKAWEHVKPIFQSVSAKVARPDGGEDPCCDWVGEDGAGHYVKMVHNGIEYGDMQLISEAYHLMRDSLGMTHDEMGSAFAEWNKGKLDSYLIEITRDILDYKDEYGQSLVERILDAAEQKGTGKWTGISALDTGIPLTLVVEAVFARALSSLKDERESASKVLTGPKFAITSNKQAFLNDLQEALYASKIISYTQGYMLFRAAGKEYNWNLNYGGIALMWRGGCIIRSAFLGKIKEAYDVNPDLPNLLLDPYFKEQVLSAQAAWRRVVAEAVHQGIPVPAMSSALAFFDGYRNANLPANLLQAQRDYFGAHTYQRIDKPRGEYFHTNWTGYGGDVTSTVWKDK